MQDRSLFLVLVLSFKYLKINVKDEYMRAEWNFFLFFNKIYFVFFLKGTVRERRRQSFHLLIHSLSRCNGWGWAKLRPAA